MKCQVEGCGRDAVLNAADKQVCRAHWGRHHRSGSFGSGRIREVRKSRGVCVADGCGKIDSGPHGYCSTHRTRITRHGDPSVVIKPSERQMPSGQDHPNWAGGDISYMGMHQRLRRLRGSSLDYLCVDCGKNAQQWSYDHAGQAEERDSEFGKYSVDPSDYSPRCIPCHKVYDLARLPSFGNPIDVSYAIAQYRSGRGVRAIATELKVSRPRLRALLVAAGESIRGPGGVRLGGKESE